jgi:hypothetical protein
MVLYSGGAKGDTIGMKAALMDGVALLILPMFQDNLPEIRPALP